MIKSFRIVNDIGDSITMDIRKPEVTGFLIASVTGLTDPKAEIALSQISAFDGAVFGNARVPSRNIVMNIIFYEGNKEKLSIEELRHKCYNYFPLRRQITFYVTNDSGTYSIKGYVESNEINIFTKQEGAQISILCPDPYFVKSSSETNTYISNVIKNFEFPCSFEAVWDDASQSSSEEPVYSQVLTDEDGINYFEYEGPFTTVSEKDAAKRLNTRRTYSKSNITVKKIPYTKTLNDADGYTAKIGDSN